MDEKVLPIKVRVNLGVMAIKRYILLPRSPEPKPHHQMQLSVIPRTPPFFPGGEVLLLCRKYSQCILKPALKMLVIFLSKKKKKKKKKNQ